MKLVVGLGNPGAHYERTRHNVGFQVLGELAQINQVQHWQHRFHGLAAECSIADGRVLLLKPQTFMNVSGRSVRAAVDYYKIEVADILLVCDDFNLPIGRLRLRAKGSSGGQKGLQDIFQHLGTEEVSRLRVGVGSPGPADAAEWVLSDFTASQRRVIEATVADAARAVECWCREGIDAAMNQFNGREGATGEP